MNKNESLCVIEDARKEFELCGEISNSAENVIKAAEYGWKDHDALVEALDKMSSVMFHLSNEPSLCNEKRIACRGDFEYLAKLLVKAKGES